MDAQRCDLFDGSLRSLRIAPRSHLLRRRTQRKERLRSLLLSTAARDPLFDGSLRSLRCSLGCRRLRQIWRNGEALFRHLLLQIGGVNIENPLPSSRGDEKHVSSLGPPISGARSGPLIDGVGLRGTACLWQAVPKRSTRTDLMASVLAGAERREAARRDERDLFSP